MVIQFLLVSLQAFSSPHLPQLARVVQSLSKATPQLGAVHVQPSAPRVGQGGRMQQVPHCP